MIRIVLRRWWYKLKKRIYDLMMGEDMPFKIALGFSLGSACNFLPTMGLGFPIAILLALVTKSSILASLVGETLCKLLLPFFYYLNLLVGSRLYTVPDFSLDLAMMGRMARDWGYFLIYAKAFLVGAVINSCLFVFIFTLLIYYVLIRHRERIVALVRRWKEDNY